MSNRNREYRDPRNASKCQDCGASVVSPGGSSKKRCDDCAYALKLKGDRERRKARSAAA